MIFLCSVDGTFSTLHTLKNDQNTTAKYLKKNEEKYPIYYKLLFKSSNGHFWNQKCSQCYAFLNVIFLYQHVTVQKTFQNSMEKYVTSLGFFFPSHMKKIGHIMKEPNSNTHKKL